MNLGKLTHQKLTALMTALVLVFTLMGSSILASAEINTSKNPVTHGDMKIEATRSGDQITWTATATKDLDIDTMGIKPITYDRNQLSYVSFDSGIFVKESAIYNDLLALTGGNGAKAGETLFAVTYNIADGFKQDTDYTVTFTVDDAGYGDEVYSWADGSAVSVVYREDTDIQTFNVKIIDDGRTVLDQDIEEGKTVAKPADGSKNGYTFDGWFADGENTPYDFSKPVTKPLNIVARYTKNTPSGNKVVDLNDIKITKTIKSAKHLDPEEKNFTFTFKALDGAPEIGTRNITNSDTIALGDITFPGPGVYKYEISEDKDASATDWTYDSTVYYLAITIQEDANGNLTATPIAISKQADFSGDKVGSADFENEYAPATELTVSKDVVNAEGALDKDKKFSFTITFENPGVSGDLKDKTNNKAIAYDAPYTFTLGDDEEITFALPAGTQYTLVEDGTTAYEAKADVYSGSEQGTPATAEAGKDLSVTAVALKNGNAVEVTNTYTVTPLMGVVHKYGAVLVAMLIALAAIVAIVWDRKRKLQSEE